MSASETAILGPPRLRLAMGRQPPPSPQENRAQPSQLATEETGFGWRGLNMTTRSWKEKPCDTRSAQSGTSKSGSGAEKECDTLYPYLVTLAQHNASPKAYTGNEKACETAKRNFCGNALSYRGGATANLWRHVRVKHPGASLLRSNPVLGASQQQGNDEVVDDPVEPSHPSPDESGARPSVLSGLSSLSLSTSGQSAPPRPLPIARGHRWETQQQATISHCMNRALTLSKTAKLDEQLVKLIVEEYHPFSLVEGEHFKQFVYALNPNYRLPTRKPLSSTLLPQLHAKVAEQVRMHLRSATAVCLTTDGWTSMTNESYIGLTAHFIDENCEVKSYLLDCFSYNERHTAENIASELQKVVTEWDIQNKICAAVSDSAANVTAAIRACGWRHNPCFAHVLNLVVQAGVREISSVQAEVKAIVRSFKHSSHGLARLQAMQQQMGMTVLKLKQDVPTRWNSTYEMFSMIVHLKDAVLSTLAILDAGVEQLSQTEWTVIEKSCDILKPFLAVTTEMSSEKSVTVSKRILLARALITHVDNAKEDPGLPEDCKKMVKMLSEQLAKRFGDVETVDALQMAAGEDRLHR
ncbi:zinc finger BED domain-containing protein 6-like [Ornithodoros turicata]|uniref:zinc finger BED domain-containing protein 6-like n=1 Tax=Ornithodoros turicata TaxID=34597 RepID=UPI003139A40A